MKWFLIFSIFIMVLTIILAVKSEDIQTYHPSGIGTLEAYSKTFAEDQTNPFFSHEEEAEISGAWAKRKIIYDLIVEAKENYYSLMPNRFKIIIKNMGDFVDHDTVLEYYIIGPDNRTYGESKEQILRVPPFSYNKTQCIKFGGIVERKTGNCITVLNRGINLPFNSDDGKYKIVAKYTTSVQPTIEAYDTFYFHNLTVFFIATALLFFIVIIMYIVVIIYKRNQGQLIVPEVIKDGSDNME